MNVVGSCLVGVAAAIVDLSQETGPAGKLKSQPHTAGKGTLAASSKRPHWHFPHL